MRVNHFKFTNHVVKLNVNFNFVIIFLFALFLSGCKQDKKNPPTINSLSPSVGSVAGGTVVTISGANFESGAAVTIGSKACSVISSSASQISCTTAATSSGLYKVNVVNPNKQSVSKASAFLFSSGPSISGIAPNDGLVSGGTPVTITGSGFTTGDTVSIGGVTCTSPVIVSSTTITCTTGARVAGNVNVVVTNSDSLSISASNAFTYRGAPTVTSVTPSAGAIAGGTSVTITGTGFYTAPTVTFDG